VRGGQRNGGGLSEGLEEWAGRRRVGAQGRGCLRCAFYGRVSTEDWQYPVTSRARQREQSRYLGGRPPYGYRLADAGPHPNKIHTSWDHFPQPMPGKSFWSTPFRYSLPATETRGRFERYIDNQANAPQTTQGSRSIKDWASTGVSASLMAADGMSVAAARSPALATMSAVVIRGCEAFR